MNNLHVEGLYWDGDGYLEPFNAEKDCEESCGCCKDGKCKCKPLLIHGIKDKTFAAANDAVNGIER